jgi:hypothetical protein
VTKQTLKNAACSLGLLGATLISSSSLAQVFGPGNKFPVGRVRPPAAHVATKAETVAAPTYTYTLVSYPGTLNTLGVGISPGAYDLGADGTEIDVVGAWVFADGLSQTGFHARVSGTNPVAETYELLTDPNAPTPQQAYSINDLRQVVGDYIDASGIFHSYEVDRGNFKRLDVPFAGATGTYSPAINNLGEIVGGWYDRAGKAHSYTLIGGVFSSFDPPGSAQGQFYYGINSEGDITGSYADSGGIIHGFLRKEKTYTQLDFPGAAGTFPTGINDSGVIVGGYCPTSECLTTGAGEEGFVLSNWSYSAFAIPGEPVTGLASINNRGVLMGNYLDEAGLVYTFLATP